MHYCLIQFVVYCGATLVDVHRAIGKFGLEETSRSLVKLPASISISCGIKSMLVKSMLSVAISVFSQVLKTLQDGAWICAFA